MNVVGLVVEYNPFHNGHLHHLLESKRITNSEHSIAVMSGNFLQRGEPALLDKWSRAKMAIDSGVDLVLELPFVYASGSAEFFSDGAIKLLDSLNVVDSVCFGSELGDISLLENVAEVLIDEPLQFQFHLKNSLSEGVSYPQARSIALSKYFKDNKYDRFSDIEEIVSSPNNILSIEYAKSLKKINSKIKPFTIKRKSSNYHDTNISGSIASATSIRDDFFKNKNLLNIKNVVPEPTYKYMCDFLSKHNNFNSLEWYTEIFLYLFRTISYDNISNIVDVSEGLENRILRSFNISNDLNYILRDIKTRRYTLTRIKRILIYALMGLNKDNFKRLNKMGPKYIRVLGASKNGLELLSKIKSNSQLPIITKFSNYEKLNDKDLNEMIAFDKKATDIYFTGISRFNHSPNTNLDFLISPYFSKK